MVEPSLVGRLLDEAGQDGVHQLVVGAAVQDNGRLLLIQRPGDDVTGGRWELPTGNVRPGERLDDAIARQVRDKTSLEVSGLLDHLGSFDSGSGDGTKARQFNFAVAVVTAGPVELREHVAYRWVPLAP